jgi:hypothetical protein
MTTTTNTNQNAENKKQIDYDSLPDSGTPAEMGFTENFIDECEFKWGAGDLVVFNKNYNGKEEFVGIIVDASKQKLSCQIDEENRMIEYELDVLYKIELNKIFEETGTRFVILRQDDLVDIINNGKGEVKQG